MKRLFIPALLVTPALFLAICLIPRSLSADEPPLLDRDELHIRFVSMSNWVSLEKGLACGTDAEFISEIHKNQNAPLTHLVQMAFSIEADSRIRDPQAFIHDNATTGA